MTPDWILHPLTLCLEVAAGLISCLYLVIVTSNELYSLKRKTRRYQQWTESAVQQLDRRLTRLESDESNEYRPPASADSRPATMGPDERRRIIQMLQDGATADQIAAVMQLPRPDIDLVLSCYHSVLQLNAATARRSSRMLPTSNLRKDSEE